MSEDLGPQLDPRVESEFVEPSAEAFRELVRVMAKLRSPDGCPWDQKQTHESLARHLLEETYETLEAIESGDLKALREELGDLALQVVFHSEIAFDEGAFGIADVLDDLRAKLVKRHPHVFGDVKVSGADEVVANWETIKREEKQRSSTLEGIPKALPALSRAANVFRRLQRVGFLAAEEIGTTFEKLDEEVAELQREIDRDERDPTRIEAEIGDVLFIVTALAAKHGVDPEDALRRQLERAERRFEVIERLAVGRELESLSPEEWRGYWEQAKQEHP